MSDGSTLKAQFAGVLLYELDNPSFRQLPNNTFTEQLVQQIAEDRRTNLFSESVEKCIHCPQSDNCEVGALFHAR